jgi:AcrR family transcriptional regulator
MVAVASRVPGHGQIGQIQRARVLAAVTELVCERGVAGITVAHVVERSGASRRTFYDLFGDRDDCLVAAFEHAVQRAAAVVLPAYEGAGEAWAERIGAGLGALLEFLDAEPAMGRLCVVDALAAGREVLQRRARVVEALIDAVHQGGVRPRGDSGRRPARIVAEGAVGAVLAIVHVRLCERDPKPLAGLLGRLMGMIVLPYLGAEAAACELKRRAPRARPRPVASADPLRDPGMRLTYRTMRVLLAISDLSERRSLGGRAFVGGRAPSSREVGDAAGVSDQGQISKLLWRLEHLGLIANGVEHGGRGGPNAWSLTPKGGELERAIRAQTDR